MAYTYPVDIKGVKFLYRGPSRREMVQIKSMSAGNLFEYFENLIKVCLLEPPTSFSDKEGYINLDALPFTPGDIAFLARSIEDASGFLNTDLTRYLAQKASKYSDSDEGRLDALSLLVMPGLSPDHLWNMDPPDVFRVYAIAHVLAPTMNVDERILLDPESFTKEQKEVERKLRQRKAHLESQGLLPSSMQSDRTHLEEKSYDVYNK